MPDDRSDSSLPRDRPRRDVVLALPARWRRHQDLADGVLVAARAEARPASGLRPAVALRYEPVEDRDLMTWQRHALLDLARRFDALAVEETGALGRAGQEVVYRRYSHRVRMPAGAAVAFCEVVVDHWAWISAGIGLTLSCAAAREDYAAHRDVFAAVAASVEVVPALPTAS